MKNSRRQNRTRFKLKKVTIEKDYQYLNLIIIFMLKLLMMKKV